MEEVLRGVGKVVAWLHLAPSRVLGCAVAGLAVVLVLSSCGMVGKNVGAGTAQGAMTQLHKEIAEMPPEQQGIIAERNTKAAVRGMLDELSTPERQAQLSKMIAATMSQALRSMAHPSPASSGTGGSGGGGGSAALPIEDMSAQLAKGITGALSRQLQAELGKDGSGPLATAMAASTERMTAAATAGMRKELEGLTGPCSDPEPRKCLEREVHELGKAAFSGALEGIRIPLLVLIFMLGFVACLLLLQLLGLRGGRRAPGAFPHEGRRTNGTA